VSSEFYDSHQNQELNRQHPGGLPEKQRTLLVPLPTNNQARVWKKLEIQLSLT
jgi:hypothetical protein